MVSVPVSLEYEMMELVGKGRLMLIEGDWGEYTISSMGSAVGRERMFWVNRAAARRKIRGASFIVVVCSFL